MPRMTPEQEAAYALDWELPRKDLKPAAQAAYDRLAAERAAAGPPVVSLPPLPPVAQPDAYAIVSLVLGLTWAGGIGAVLAIVFGVMSRRQAQAAGLRPSGLTTAGIVLGVIGCGFLVLWGVFVLSFFLGSH